MAKKPTDYGEHIGGARKDLAATNISDADIAAFSLSRVWPEPEWRAFEHESSLAAAFARAARDSVPPKPTGRLAALKMKRYVEQVRTLKSFADDVLSGRTPVETIVEKLSPPLRATFFPKMKLYVATNHEFSLKGIEVSETRDGKWTACGKSRVAGEIRVSAPDIESLAAVVSESFSPSASGNREKSKEELLRQAGKLFGIYSRPGKPGYFIGFAASGRHVEMRHFDTVSEAKTWFSENPETLLSEMKEYKTVPPLRKSENAERKGPSRGGGDVSPEEFANTFGFRAVEFGNWVEGDARREALSKARDALLDMCDVLGIEPSDCSLGGRLAFAFGSRGAGGKNAPLAHFEPERCVVNLTKKNGPGTIAHEWFHALDNFLFLESGGADTNASPYLSVFRNDKSRRELEAASAMRYVFDAAKSEGVAARAAECDRRRGKKYFSLPQEMCAMCFESFVSSELEKRGWTNDWLVNIVPETGFEVFHPEGDGAGFDCWPYPKEENVGVFEAPFGALMKAFVEEVRNVRERRDGMESAI